MIFEKPYFLKNPDWYKYDEKQYKYVLTDSAPEEAKKSYEEYYKIIDITK